MASSSDGSPGYSNEKWLAIVGVGEGGVDDLGANARRLVEGAEVVFGGARHLALMSSTIRGAARAWPSPFDAAMADVLALRPRRVCVLASGDPFLHGVGATLARVVTPAEMIVAPAPSAFSLAAARLGWALQDAQAISLHAQPVETLRPLLRPRVRILALTRDGAAPAAIARLLSETGFGASILHVFEALGGPRERHWRRRADEYGKETFDPLNTVAIEVTAGAEARIIPLTPGLPDSCFEHDGQITKCEIRALALSALAPRPRELLLDIGAGAGSIAIEWMLADRSLSAIAIEADTTRAARIRANAQALGAPGLRVIEGRAPEAMTNTPRPDAVFIGGGATAEVVSRAIEMLNVGGRIVANAVTLETEALLADFHARLGGSLTRVSIARATPVGRKRGWRPAMPVTLWSWTKP